MPGAGSVRECVNLLWAFPAIQGRMKGSIGSAMGFFSKLLNRGEDAPLPSLEDLLLARGLDPGLPGLAACREDFEHLRKAPEREAWADAVKELTERGLPLPPPWLDAMDKLLPELVPHWRAERENLFFRPYAEGLCWRITVDGQALPEAWLRIWGTHGEEVQDRALDHLRERSQGPLFERLPSGVYRCSKGDGLEAARVLNREFWGKLFPGQPTFLSVPTAEDLLVAPQVLLPKLVDEIGKAMQSGRPHLLAVILQMGDENLMPANLQDPHPIAQPQRELRQQDLLECLKHQEVDLGTRQGIPTPVNLIKTQQGRTITVATWQEGPPACLPETDLIVFLARNGAPLGAFFRQTLPRISELRGTPVDIWGPRRLRFDGFPTAEQLARLECFATPEQLTGTAKSPGGGKPAAPGAPPEASASSLGASPVPAHLRGLNLGVQSGND